MPEQILDLMNPEEVELLLGRDISIDATQGFDKKYFKDSFGEYLTLTQSIGALNKNSADVNAMDNIALLLSPQNPNIILNRGLEGIMRAAKAQIGPASTAMAKFSENNSLVNKLSGESISNLILSLANPNHYLLYKTNDSDHEKLAALVSKQALVKLGRTEDLSSDIPGLIKDAPAWHQTLYSRYGNDPSYLAEFLTSYASVIDVVYKRQFTYERTIKGNKQRVFNRPKLLGFFNTNLQVAQDKMDSAKTRKDKNKIWDAQIKPIQLMTATTLYDQYSK